MKRKKVIGLFLMMMMLCFSSTNALAATVNNGVTSSVPVINNTGIQPYSTSCPDTSDVYTNGTDYTVSGSASNSDLFTNKCFKGVSSIKYSITNNRSASLKVKLCYYTSSGNVIYGTQSVTIPANGTTSASFTSLDSGKYYFIQFVAPSDFSGSVKGNK